jgi:hypothetical protein
VLASSRSTIAGFASEYVQPFSTFCTNEANGESITKTMLQHEQYNQRGYKYEYSRKVCAADPSKRPLLLGERETTLTRGSAEAIVEHAMVDALARSGAQ